jgi:hypothetical protein
MSGGDDPLASLHPAYFALVMATGIVSIAWWLLDLPSDRRAAVVVELRVSTPFCGFSP